MHMTDDECLERALADQSRERSHADDCTLCRDSIERFRALFAAMAIDRQRLQPGRQVVQRAHDLFDTHGPERLATRIQRWLAELRFDSAAMVPAMAGARGAGADARQLLFSTEDYDLDVLLALDTTPVTLRGQALPRSGTVETVAVRPVILIPPAGPARTTSTDTLGAFRFDDVRSGAYRIRVEVENGDIEAELEIDASR